MLQRSQRYFLLLVGVMLTASCVRKSNIEQASGDVPVQIAVQSSESEYTLRGVTLSGITNLKEVEGFFAKFFYAPGSNNNQLVGSAPQAHFIRTSSFFVPSDLISMQMATIYYHMQNLAALDNQIGAQGVNQWPRSIGLETQVVEGDSKQTKRNNAFYNGQVDAMMFVPYTQNGLQMAMNAGIIAHEHFHSLFYKVVIRPAIQNKKLFVNAASIHGVQPADSKMQRPERLSDKERMQIFNETLLRGQNEGLADFWGWVYTSDPEFIRWSLPTSVSERTLNLSEKSQGNYLTTDMINSEINMYIQSAPDLQEALIYYSYKIGTPYARFLKQLTTMQSENKKIDLQESKIKVAQIVFQYLQQTATQLSSLKDQETLKASDLFVFVAQQFQGGTAGLKMDSKDCEFLIKYINRERGENQKLKACDASALIVDQK